MTIRDISVYLVRERDARMGHRILGVFKKRQYAQEHIEYATRGPHPYDSDALFIDCWYLVGAD